MSQDTALDKVHEPELVSGETLGTKNLSLPLEERAALCREAIKAARLQANTAGFSLALNVMEAKENGYARMWGFTSFDDYAEQELQMGSRKAYYLVDVGQAIRAAKVTAEQADAIGWTKLKEISKALIGDPASAPRLLALAQNMSTKQLQQYLRDESNKVQVTEGRQATPTVMRFEVKFENEAMRAVSEALAIAYADIGQENASVAIAKICSEWSVARGSAQSGMTLEDWLGFLQRTYGVRLERVETGESMEALLGEEAPEVGDLAGLDTVDKELNDLLGA